MNRRQFLSTSTLSVFFSGCIEGDIGRVTETDSPPSGATAADNPSEIDTETGSASPEGATPECWPSMCEGTTLVEVVVSHDFSGTVTLRAGCRDEELTVQSGTSVRIDRREDAETCEISLFVGREQVFRETVADYERVTLTVSSNGDVDDEWVVY